MPSRNKRATGLIVLVASASALAITGCGQKTVKAAAPVATTPMPQPADSKPLTNVAPDTTATPPEVAEAPPPAPPPSSTAPLAVGSPRAKPVPPPHKQPSEPQTAETPTEQSSRPQAPLISPQMSANDQATYAHKTDDDISVAEKNLQQSVDKRLSAAQLDLVEKIQSFLSQSREASKAGDWARAQNLAQKARLLSVELVDSL
ncbi:MAG: hypothetical protein WCD49_01580 [Candidatus Acidiferrales bacterium]|jgi:hypothetical protein